jgi:arabinoxylan arabinofuranohydrolase
MIFAGYFRPRSLVSKFSWLALTFATAATALADYPIVSQRYAADPTGLEYNGRIYIYCSDDDDNTGLSYIMNSITCFSTDDLKNWTDHGVVFRVPKNAGWANLSWAPSVITNNGLIYMYFANGATSIGVSTSSVPTGPFVDARRSALITSSTPGAATASQWYFDPCAFIDDNGQPYLYFGGQYPTNARVILLSTSMTNVIGSASPVFATNFFEASYMNKRGGTYYFTYSTTASAGLVIGCETNSNPTNGFVPQGAALPNPPQNVNNNNHASIFSYQGNWYIAYHNRAVALQNGLSPSAAVYQRSICLDQVNFNANGTMQQVTPTTDGLTQLKNLDPFNQVEAETIAQERGIKTEVCSEGGLDVTSITNGSWIRVRGVDFGTGASTFFARVASAGSGGNIELHLDSLAGTLLGTCAVSPTGGWQIWGNATCSLAAVAGVHDLYFKYVGGAGNLFNVNWWQLENCSPYIRLSVPAAATEGDKLAGQGSLSTAVPVTNDLVVNLASSNTNLVTVPASVVIPAGQTNAMFDLTIVDNPLLDLDQLAIITATSPDCSYQAMITIHEKDSATLSVALPASASKSDGTLVNDGSVSVGTAVGENITVALASSDPSKLTVPSTVIISNGQTSAVFNLNIVNNNLIDGPQNVSVSAHVTNWIDGSASMTILDVNPLPDHFAWSIVSSPQYAGQPFNVTNTALDSNSNQVNYMLPVNLSAWAPGPAPAGRTLLGSPSAQDYYSGNGEAVVGYSFTPNSNLVATAVRSYFGDKVELWTDSGMLLAAQSVASVEGTWVETPLTNAMVLLAGLTYRLGAHITNNGTLYWDNTLAATFPDGTINASWSVAGDTFPNVPDSGQYLVDLRYGTNVQSVPLTPVVSGNFNHGTWSGNLKVLQSAAGVTLQASIPGHSGQSLPFDVIIAPRLTILAAGGSVMISWPMVPAGFNLEQTANLSSGPWTGVTNAPVPVGGYYIITNTSTATATFYRLHKP